MKHGFSLVELSIVLVILGLLVGGVMSGQSLIRAAELRSVSQEFFKYQAATNVFRDKYFALPGDMTNAADFWGYPGGSSANCPATAGTGTETCNGNGNGNINIAPGANQYGESFMFWQHLSNAGLIEGNYTGVAGSVGRYHTIPGENAPQAKISNATWNGRTLNVTSGTGRFWGYYPSHIQFGSPYESGAKWPDTGVITAEEVWNIDTKMDDGKPARGLIVSNTVCTTATAGNDYDAEYEVSEDEKCTLHFFLDGSIQR